MKKFSYIIIFIIIGGLICFINPITDYLAKILSSNHKLVIDSPNKYFKNKSYNYVKQSTDFLPYSKQDLLNIYYTILDRGYEEFTFYCPSEYVDCLDDVKEISSPDSKVLSNLNYFVSPFNTEKKIITYYTSSGEITVKIEKLYTNEQINKINNKIDEILKEIITDDMKDDDKILAIHDYIINHTKYDITKNDGKSKYNSHISYGTLIEGYSLCNGYADSMALFLDRLGITNYRIASNTSVWNAVLLNNEWLHIDLTWDDPVTEGKDVDTLLHKFYLINTKKLEDYNITDHNFDRKVFVELA